MLNESFAQARTVRAYRLEAEETRRAQDAFTQLYRALLRMTRTRARVDPVLEVLGGAAVAAVIGFAGWRAAIGTHTIGNFTGFVAALLIASRPLRALGSLNAAIQEGLAGLVRVFAIVDEQPRIVDAPDAAPLPAGRGHVAFRDVGFVYPDGRAGLAGLSFEAAPGTTVALVGPSGAGKSTALALIPRLQDVTGGAVTVDGADVRAVTLASLRDAIAYVGQDTLLFDDTVEANIRMGRPGGDRAQVEAAAAAAAAADFIAALPEGYDTRVGPGGQRLSGGQRQRIALARACCATLASCCSTRRPARSTPRARPRCRPRLPGCARAAPRSSSRTGSPPCGTPTSWWRWRTATAVEQGTHAALLEQDGLYARLVRSQALAQ